MNKNIDREPTNLADYDKDGLEVFFEKNRRKTFSGPTNYPVDP